MKLSRLLDAFCVSAALSFFIVCDIQAATVTFDISGAVTSTTGTFFEGATGINISVTFDDTATDIDPDPNDGRYRNVSLFEVRLIGTGQSWTATPGMIPGPFGPIPVAAAQMDVFSDNNTGLEIVDELGVNTFLGNPPQGNTIASLQIRSMNLGFFQATPLNSGLPGMTTQGALPEAPLQWDSGAFSIIFEDSTGAFVTQPVVRFSPVPLPTTLWLLGSGLLGLVGIARKKVA